MAWLSGGAKSMTNPVKAFGLPTLLSDFTLSERLTKACSGRAISMSLMQGLSVAAVRARR